ncbi:MATE family efflux transporter [Clostridium sp.]|uniref:MATE family efflux transporter n=1 Tax=Clostridium sp. TaxID=1506 RepID=UPI0032180D47
MSKKIDLLKDKEFKLIIKYMVPCVLGMLGLSLCILVDTIFIGRSLGDLGLAALNIALPTYNVFNAIALTFGVGGATVLAISMGEKKLDKVNEIFTTAMVGSICISLFISLMNILFIDKICYALGASSVTFPLVKKYVEVILFFNWAFILICILNVFVRCDKAPKLAMVAMISSNMTNIILDYIFIFPMNMGMGGAALATALAQVVGIAILLLHFIKRNNTMSFKFKTFSFKTLGRVLRTGATSFITELSSGFIIFIFNLSVFNLLGDIGVSAYGIITNIILIFTAVFNGISQGIQPLISINYGAKKHDRVTNFYNLSIIIAFTLGAIFLILGLLFPEKLIGMFSKDKGELLKITIQGTKIYFFGLLLIGVNIINIGYLQAIEKSKVSLCLSLLRGMVFITILVSILPKFFHINGVWATVPVTEILTLISFIILKKYISKKEEVVIN